MQNKAITSHSANEPLLRGHYARTSTADQQAGLEAQLRDLKAAGCTRIFDEQVSSVDKDKRDQLAAALDYAREGDVLIVTKLDRLARSVAHLVEMMRVLDDKGVKLRILGSDPPPPVPHKTAPLRNQKAAMSPEIQTP